MTAPEVADSQRTVLVVEDETSIKDALKLVLELAGYTVRTASNGERGLSSMNEVVPDVVISDYMMPIMNGIDMVLAMRTDQRLATTPVILLSAVPPSEPGFRNAVNVFLRKPVTADKIIGMVGKMMDSP